MEPLILVVSLGTAEGLRGCSIVRHERGQVRRGYGEQIDGESSKERRVKRSYSEVRLDQMVQTV